MRREVSIPLVIGLICWGTIGMAVALSGPSYPVTSGATFETNSDLTVTTGQDIQQPSGNPFTADSVTLSQDNITFRGSNADVRVAQYNVSAGGTRYTNLTQMRLGSGQALIDRPDTTTAIGASATVDELAVGAAGLNISRSGPAEEIVVSSGGQWTLVVNNSPLNQGETLLVEDAQGNVLGSAAAQAGGDVVVTGLPTATDTRLNLRRGPSVLNVFREAAPTQRATNVNLTIRFFSQDGSGSVVQKTVSNGQVRLTDIPRDKPLTITVDEDNSTQFAFRRTIIESVFEQSEVYLLNTSSTQQAAVEFRLQDRSGDFPPRDTQLLIEKPITKDFNGDGVNETRYQVVAGDTFGSAGEFPTILERNERYRLRAISPGDQTRILGGYVAARSDTATVSIDDVSINIPAAEGYASDLELVRQDADGDGIEEEFVRVTYVDRGERTEQFDITVVREGTNNTVFSTTINQGASTFSATQQVAQNATNSTYRLDWTAVRETEAGVDEQISGEDFAGEITEFAQRFPIDNRWLSLIGFVTIVSLGGLVVIVDPEIAGLVVVGVASVLTLVGVVNIPAPALGLGGAVAVIALVGRRV
jgi:hypothetical protein